MTYHGPTAPPDPESTLAGAAVFLFTLFVILTTFLI